MELFNSLKSRLETYDKPFKHWAISQPFTELNSFQIKSIDKEKLIIKTELDIHSISQLLPKNSLVRSISKEPNLADLFK